MNTVYEWLHAIGKDELIRLYAEYDRLDRSKIKSRDMPLFETDASYRRRIDAYISDILSYTPRENSEMVFFAVESYERGRPITAAELVSLKEIENEHIVSYSWILTDREEWLGYHVADTKLSLSKSDEMLAYILYKASFFGYTRDEFKRGREEFKRSIADAEKDFERTNHYKYEEILTDKRRQQEQNDPKEELPDTVRDAEAALYKYCFDREIAELRSAVRDLLSEPAVNTVDVTVVLYSYPYTVTDNKYIRIHVSDDPVVLNDTGMVLSAQETANFMSLFEFAEDLLTDNYGLDLIYFDYLNCGGFLVKGSNGQPLMKFKSELRVANDRPHDSAEDKQNANGNEMQAKLFRGKFLIPAQRDWFINGNKYDTYEDAFFELERVVDSIATKDRKTSQSENMNEHNE
ncbi:MAG: hypothetical protein IJG50_08635 [Clostridia bacterium]|nr:hypothetical protein [Clostridia bacterium]